MNFRQLEYFLAVCKLGSFTAASQRLGVAQPTLTKSMRALEADIGVALLERLPRGVALTPAGDVLKRHAERIGVQLQDALAEVASLGSIAHGTVTIGAGPSWLRRLLPEAVATIIASDPNVRINVVGGFDDVLLKALRARELDFVVLELPPLADAAEFQLERLTTDRLGVFARIAHPLTDGRAVGLRDLLAYPWIMSPKSTRPQQRLNAIFVAAGLPPPAIAVETDSVAFLLRIVASTDALTFTVSSTAKMLEAQGTAMLHVPEMVAEREAGIITRRDGWLPPAAGMTISELRRICSRERQN
ncbi:MAG TPA: LysR family transcriptional regulator [Devosiaceae bacterium]|jgi:LysR family transcriptional regulator of gallate degradation|nr:LysR family transcriptional regulator [Devosiaceae bacterium]